MLLRKKRGPEVNSDWLFIIRWVNPIDVTVTRVPTEKLHYAIKHARAGGYSQHFVRVYIAVDGHVMKPM